MQRIVLLFVTALLTTACLNQDDDLVRRPDEPVRLGSTVDLRIELPMVPDSVRFAVLGDTGTGDDEQYEVAHLMNRYRQRFDFEFVLLLGDNLYGNEDPEDYAEKFELPYKELLSEGVEFYASLGNHDEPPQRYYKYFNMDGERYYTFKKGNVHFVALDSDYMNPEQLEWLDQQLSSSNSRWKICFFHHPLYSSGRRHGPDDELREVLEPLFLRHGVDAVFSGHEHFYERLHPQNGIYYFISGAGAKLRRGNIRPTADTAAGFDSDRSFMLVEIAGDTMHVQTISRTGHVVDIAQLALLNER